jgi:sigma-B regulation protein RsbU (phosphoserine phosphatase)
MLGIFSQALEQGSTAVYRRKFGENEYEYIGDGIKDITGYSASEISYAMWDEIIIHAENKGDLAEMSYKEAGKYFREGNIDRWLTDLQIKTKSGMIRWVMDMCTVLRDESGKRYGCLGILFDITDRKLAEEELARTSKELSQKNEEMATDLNMAREVQMAFLEMHPTHFPPDVSEDKSAVQFYHRYLPATTLAGDFFDILPISNHKVGVLICDVMGHGARASLLTAYLQGLIEELMPIAADTGAFMTKLNYGLNSIMAQFYTGIFATVFYLVVDTKTGKMYCTNAGHPGPLLIRRKKKSVVNIRNAIKKTEPALGLLKDFPYTVYESKIDNDDVVLLYTDGIYEVENKSGELFGKERLFRSVQNQLALHPDQLLEGITKDINGFSASSEFKDDVCIVTMHVKKAKM